MERICRPRLWMSWPIRHGVRKSTGPRDCQTINDKVYQRVHGILTAKLLFIWKQVGLWSSFREDDRGMKTCWNGVAACLMLCCICHRHPLTITPLGASMLHLSLLIALAYPLIWRSAYMQLVQRIAYEPTRCSKNSITKEHGWPTGFLTPPIKLLQPPSTNVTLPLAKFSPLDPSNVGTLLK